MYEPLCMHIGPWSKGATLRAYRIDSGGRWSDGLTLRAFLMPRFRAAGAHREELYIPASLADISAYYFGHRARTMRLGFQRSAKSNRLTTGPPPQSNKPARSVLLTASHTQQGERAAKSVPLTAGPPPQPNKAAKSSRLTTPRVHQGTGAAKSPRLTTPPNRIEPEDPAPTGRHHSTDHAEPSRDRHSRRAGPAR